jgi:hypothetical protein
VEARQEFKFLTELRYLTDSALLYADEIRHYAGHWESARGTKLAALRNAAEPRKRFQAMQDLNSSGASQVSAQTQLFSFLESFLALWGRMSLILFPQAESKNEVRKLRAEHLRSLLCITSDHRLSDRLMRNKWLHFDEVLDDLGSQYRNSHRFVHSEEYDEVVQRMTLRVLIVDQLKLDYAGVGVFEQESLFEAVTDLEERVQQAIRTWGERYPDPIQTGFARADA